MTGQEGTGLSYLEFCLTTVHADVKGLSEESFKEVINS